MEIDINNNIKDIVIVNGGSESDGSWYIPNDSGYVITNDNKMYSWSGWRYHPTDSDFYVDAVQAAIRPAWTSGDPGYTDDGWVGLIIRSDSTIIQTRGRPTRPNLRTEYPLPEPLRSALSSY